MTTEKTQETNLTTTEEKQEISINSQSAAVGFFGGKNFGLWTSLPVDDKIAIAQAMGDSDYNLRDYFKADPFAKPIKMVNCLAHGVQLVNDNEETIDASRVVIIAEDGKTYSTVAEGARSSLGNLFAIFGLPPYNPPLSIVAREVKTRRGFYTLNIIPVETINES
jgi:hypothetical protein